jgi:hypothetical protein
VSGIGGCADASGLGGREAHTHRLDAAPREATLSPGNRQPDRRPGGGRDGRPFHWGASVRSNVAVAPVPTVSTQSPGQVIGPYQRG